MYQIYKQQSDECFTEKYYVIQKHSNFCIDQNHDQSNLNEKISILIKYLLDEDQNNFRYLMKVLGEILKESNEKDISSINAYFQKSIIFLIDFNNNSNNSIKTDILLLVYAYFAKILSDNQILFKDFFEKLVQLFIFENDDSENTKFNNSLIINCICEIIRIKKELIFIELIQCSLYNEIIVDKLILMKLITYLSKYGLFSFFQDNYISIGQQMFLCSETILKDDNTQKITVFFEYLYKIFKKSPIIIAFFPIEQTEKIFSLAIFSNCFFKEVLKVVKVIMKSFEDNDDERLIIAINLINFNEVIKSTLIDNYEIVNIALKILVICFRNYTNCLEIFVEQLWFDLINNFQRFPLQTKSLTIELFTCFFNPKIKFQIKFALDSFFVHIITEHMKTLYINDIVNILFIFQNLICLALFSNEENIFREILNETDIVEQLEIIQDEEIDELKYDGSIDNIFLFMRGNKV